jgi:hypothetical protein
MSFIYYGERLGPGFAGAERVPEAVRGEGSFIFTRTLLCWWLTEVGSSRVPSSVQTHLA